MVSFGLYLMWILQRPLQSFSGYPLEIRPVLPVSKRKINTDRHLGWAVLGQKKQQKDPGKFINVFLFAYLADCPLQQILKAPMLRYPGLWFAFNSGCQSASVLITSILICYYNLMKTSFHYMNGYKYTHMTNSCYKFSGSSINRQDALPNTSCGFNILSLSSSEEKFD